MVALPIGFIDRVQQLLDTGRQRLTPYMTPELAVQERMPSGTTGSDIRHEISRNEVIVIV
jgi:hypothetical protein